MPNKIGISGISKDTQDHFVAGIGDKEGKEGITEIIDDQVGTDEVVTQSTQSTASTARKTDEADEVGTQKQKPKRLKPNFSACSACKSGVAMWKWSRNGNVFCVTCMRESMEGWNEDDGPMGEFLDITGGFAILYGCASKAT